MFGKGKVQLMLAKAMTMMGLGPETMDAMALTAKGKFKNGTQMRKQRNRGPFRTMPSGSKLSRKAKNSKLAIMNPSGRKDGNIAAYFRDVKQRRMLSIQAEHGYGNCNGLLH